MNGMHTSGYLIPKRSAADEVSGTVSVKVCLAHQGPERNPHLVEGNFNDSHCFESSLILITFRKKSSDSKAQV